MPNAQRDTPTETVPESITVMPPGQSAAARRADETVPESLPEMCSEMTCRYPSSKSAW